MSDQTTIRMDHGHITLDTDEFGEFRASCLCGWQSTACEERSGAAGEGNAHLLVERDGKVVTADCGEISFPDRHPAWCDVVDHVQFAVECIESDGSGVANARDVTAHSAGCSSGTLWPLRSPASDEVIRDGGVSWMLTAKQELRPPYTALSGPASEPLIHLELTGPGRGERITAQMTTGEARVLAAHLLALCDHIDLADVSR